MSENDTNKKADNAPDEQNAKHTNFRDEQFWFTAAVVAFNSLLIGKDAPENPKCYLVAASALVSAVGFYLILNRWVGSARTHASEIRKNPKLNEKVGPPEKGRFRHYLKEAPIPEIDSAFTRLKYFLGVELWTGVKAIPYIVAECSGSFFYLLLIVLTFTGVLLKFGICCHSCP